MRTGRLLVPHPHPEVTHPERIRQLHRKHIVVVRNQIGIQLWTAARKRWSARAGTGCHRRTHRAQPRRRTRCGHAARRCRGRWSAAQIRRGTWTRSARHHQAPVAMVRRGSRLAALACRSTPPRTPSRTHCWMWKATRCMTSGAGRTMNTVVSTRGVSSPSRMKVLTPLSCAMGPACRVS